MLITNNHFKRGEIILENVINPIRSGSIKLSVGRTTYNDHTYAYIMMDNLDWIFRFKPSFVMLFPSEESLNSENKKSNAIIVYPKNASRRMEFNELGSGTAKLKTYFFGNEKKDRAFDLYYRFFEIGFTLSKIDNLDKSIFKLNKNTIIEISSEDYTHPTVFTGKTDELIASARVVRVN